MDELWYIYEMPTLKWKVIYLPMAQWPTECRIVWRDIVAPMLKGQTSYTGSDKAQEGFPVVVGLPNVGEMQYAFITKAGEKGGSTYVVSPQPLTWIDDFYVGSMPRVVDATAMLEKSLTR